MIQFDVRIKVPKGQQLITRTRLQIAVRSVDGVVEYLTDDKEVE